MLRGEKVLRFSVHASDFRVWSREFRVQGLGCREGSGHGEEPRSVSWNTAEFGRNRVLRGADLQEYLAHKKQRPPRTLQ
jgi:hypothetical protein